MCFNSSQFLRLNRPRAAWRPVPHPCACVHAVFQLPLRSGSFLFFSSEFLAFFLISEAHRSADDACGPRGSTPAIWCQPYLPRLASLAAWQLFVSTSSQPQLPRVSSCHRARRVHPCPFPQHSGVKCGQLPEPTWTAVAPQSTSAVSDPPPTPASTPPP